MKAFVVLSIIVLFLMVLGGAWLEYSALAGAKEKIEESEGAAALMEVGIGMSLLSGFLLMIALVAKRRTIPLVLAGCCGMIALLSELIEIPMVPQRELPSGVVSMNISAAVILTLATLGVFGVAILDKLVGDPPNA